MLPRISWGVLTGSISSAAMITSPGQEWLAMLPVPGRRDCFCAARDFWGLLETEAKLYPSFHLPRLFEYLLILGSELEAVEKVVCTLKEFII